MPVALLSAYARMLPRIEREESVRLVNAVAYAFGSMSKEDASAFQRRLNGDRKPRFASPLQAAAALGIPIKRG